MKAEKMIKAEAKKSLSGNWPAAISAIFVLLFIPVVAALIIVAAYGILGDSEMSELFSEDKLKTAVFILLHAVAVASVLLLSPLYNGFVRFFAKAANNEEAEMSDVFYFFDNGQRYKKAVAFMSGILVKCFGIFLACEVMAAVAAALAENNDVLTVVSIVLVILGVVGAFLWIHRFAFHVMLFSYKDYDAASAVKTGAAIAKGNVGKLIKLTISFVPWLLLMFFVVPFIYVYPYMTCAYFVSVKYISNSWFEKQNHSAQIESQPIGGYMPIQKPVEQADSEPPVVEPQPVGGYTPIQKPVEQVVSETQNAEAVLSEPSVFEPSNFEQHTAEPLLPVQDSEPKAKISLKKSEDSDNDSIALRDSI